MFSINMKNGKTIDLKLTLGTVEKIKSRLHFDLLSNGREFIDKLFDPRTIPAIIGIMAEPEFERLGITAEDVLEQFDGESTSDIFDKFQDELCRFFVGMRQAPMAQLIRKAMATKEETDRGLVQTIQDNMEISQISGEIISTAQRELQESIRNISHGTN
jgi:hypothetical protein